MKLRKIVTAMFILTTLLGSALAQPKKRKTQANPPALETVLSGTPAQSDFVLSEVVAVQPEAPLGPLDILKEYETAMSFVAEKMAADFSVIVQTQEANQITREQAEYLLGERYQLAMMQFQVLSALHDVLKHDIDQTAEQAKGPRISSSDEVLIVPLPSSSGGSQ